MKGVEQSQYVYVASAIKKLQPSWSKFAKILKQKSNKLSIDDLFSALRIEDKHCSFKYQKN